MNDANNVKQQVHNKVTVYFGSGFNKRRKTNDGNILYTHLIKKRANSYSRLPINKEGCRAKRDIAEHIVEYLEQQGAKFLEDDKSRSRTVLLTREDVHGRVMQALRDENTRKNKKDRNDQLGSNHFTCDEESARRQEGEEDLMNQAHGSISTSNSLIETRNSMAGDHNMKDHDDHLGSNHFTCDDLMNQAHGSISTRNSLIETYVNNMTWWHYYADFVAEHKGRK